MKKTARPELWRDMRGLRDPDRFDAWACRIAVNPCCHGLIADLILEQDGLPAP